MHPSKDVCNDSEVLAEGLLTSYVHLDLPDTMLFVFIFSA